MCKSLSHYLQVTDLVCSNELLSLSCLTYLVGRKYEGSFGAIFGAMTSRQSNLIRYGSVSLILSAENCGKRANERSCLRL